MKILLQTQSDKDIPRFGRWHVAFPSSSQVTHVELTAPDGRIFRRPVFRDQPANFEYDDRGYEHVTASGAAFPAVRFTPDCEGQWTYRVFAGAGPLDGGAFTCVPSREPGYVEVSRRDPRYFAFTSGRSYIPIGLNLCWPVVYELPAGREFAKSGERGTLGVREYERWFKNLADNGGNFARLWLGRDYLQCQVGDGGAIDLLQLAVLDQVVERARHHGIRLKLCLEYFRTLDPALPMSRQLRHPDGTSPQSMDEWFQSEKWQALWWRKVEALTARYGDDPVVMAWELWNEIECCQTSNWSVQRDWTRQILPELKALTPRNLVTNSLGSFDRPAQHQTHDDFKMTEMEFQQVHRYLDQGATALDCTDPVSLGVEAVRWARRPDRPVLLAETGAVNDCHTGPFRFYRWDHDGLIFHDMTYPAFFAGAAGCGHIWHWDSYVDNKNLWTGYGALSEALSGVESDREAFQTLDLSTPDAWVLVLKGRTTVLGWVRSRSDCWQASIRDWKPAALLRNITIDLKAIGVTDGIPELFRPWPGDGRGRPTLEDGRLHLPAFRHGLLFRVRRVETL